MFAWIRGIFGKRLRPDGRELFDALTEREQAILLRESADSSKNALDSPGNFLSGSDGIVDSMTRISLNPAVRQGAVPNVGIPSQSLDETRKK